MSDGAAQAPDLIVVRMSELVGPALDRLQPEALQGELQQRQRRGDLGRSRRAGARLGRSACQKWIRQNPLQQTSSMAYVAIVQRALEAVTVIRRWSGDNGLDLFGPRRPQHPGTLD